MDPATAALLLQGGSTLFGIMGSNKASRAEALRSEQQARQMEIDRKVMEARALEDQNRRIEEYNLARSSNNAQFSFQIGGGESSSLAAFAEYQRLTKDQDVATSQRTGFMESSSRSVAALIERQRGSSARSVSKINNMSRLFDLGSQISKTYVPKPDPSLTATKTT